MHIFVSRYKGACNYTDNYYGFKSDNLKWRPNLVFPILMAQMIFSQFQQAPGPDFRKVGKSLANYKGHRVIHISNSNTRRL